MNQNFKKGDNVRLIDGLEIGKTYHGYVMLDSMFFAGDEQIEECREFSCRIGIYYYPYSVLERVEPC